MKHADISDFIRLAGGELETAPRGEIEAHLARCDACRAEQRRFLAVQRSLGEWTVDAGPRDVWTAVEQKLDRSATIILPRWRTVAAWPRVAAAVVAGIGLGHVIGRLSLPSSPTTSAPAAQVAELEAADGLLLHALESPSPAGLFPTVLDMLDPVEGREAVP